MKQNLKMLGLLGLLLGLASGLYAAGGSEENAEETEAPITIWAWDANFNIPVMEEAKRMYLEKDPDAVVHVVDFAKGDLEQKLHTILASGQTSNLPDITLIEDYNAKIYLESYPGAFADLTGKINHDEFTDYKVELMTVDGKIYGVPFDSGVAALFYRKDLVEKIGYSEADMENLTWDELVELLIKYKEATGKSLMGEEYQNQGMSAMMLQSAGSWYSNDQGEVNLVGNTALASALEVYKKMFKSNAVDETDGWAEYVGPLNSGDHGITATGGWILSTIKAEPSQSGLWRIAPVPLLNHPDAAQATSRGGSSWYVLEKSPSKERSIELLKTAFENVGFYQTILDTIGAVGSYTPASQGEAYNKSDPFFGGQKVFVLLSDYMKTIPSINYGKYTREIESAISAVMLDILEENISIEEGLEIAQKQAVGLLQ